MYLEGEGVGSEGEGVGGVGLGEAAEEGERGAVGDEVVRVRVHRRRLLRRAPQRRVLGLHLHLRRAPAPAVVVGGRLAAARSLARCLEDFFFFCFVFKKFFFLSLRLTARNLQRGHTGRGVFISGAAREWRRGAACGARAPQLSASASGLVVTGHR